MSLRKGETIIASGGMTTAPMGVIQANPSLGNIEIGDVTAWGWVRVPLTRVVTQYNTSFALEDNFLVNKSDKTIRVLVSANGMFYHSYGYATTCELAVDYRLSGASSGSAVADAYLSCNAQSWNSVQLTPTPISVAPGAKLSLSVRFSNAGTAQVSGGSTYLTIQEIDAPLLLSTFTVPANTEILNLVYPVGSLYLSTVTTSPSVLFGGTWERITGYYLHAGDNPGTTGGSSTSGSTALTIDQIPSHGHSVGVSSSGAHSHSTQGRTGGSSPAPAIFESYAGASGTRTVTVPRSGTNGAHTHTVTQSNAGGGEGHTHTVNPPYIDVYVWKRTA